MNRLGWLTLAGLVIIVLGFIAMLGPSRTSLAPEPMAIPSRNAAALVIPVVGVAPGQLVDSFVDPRGGGRRSHGAIDIPASRGTSVVATADGRVEKLFDSRPGGHTLYQRSRDGDMLYYYAHLDSYAPGIAEGSAVRRGQPIGFVGSTGDADPAAPHLHFEVHRMARGEGWWQGRAVDPYPLLAGRPAGR